MVVGMPRAGWVKPQADQRLSDHVSVGLLTRVFTPELIDQLVVRIPGEIGHHPSRPLPARNPVKVELVIGQPTVQVFPCPWRPTIRTAVRRPGLSRRSWRPG